MTHFTDRDYEALEAAVMETPRGRWFLGEYARRARAGDTQLLLEAIRKLERGMAGLNAPAGSADLIGELDAMSQELAVAISDLAALRSDATPGAFSEPDEAGDHPVDKLDALDQRLAQIKTRLDALIGAERPRAETALTRDNLSYFGGDEDLFEFGAEAGERGTAPSPSLSLIDNPPPPDGPPEPAEPAAAEHAADAGEPAADKERIVFIRRASSEETSIPLADEPAEPQPDNRPAHGG